MKKVLLILLFPLYSITGLCQNSDDYVSSGQEKWNIGNYSGAIEDYTKAILLNPQNSDAYFFRSRAKRSLMNQIGHKANYDTKNIQSDLDSSEYLSSSKQKAVHDAYFASRDSLIKIAKGLKMPDSYITDNLNPPNTWLIEWISTKLDKYSSGENDNSYNIIPIVKNIISANFKPNINSPFMCSFLFKINNDGIITDVTCLDQSCDKGIVNKIISVIKSIKVAPFAGDDGKNYNSKAVLNIDIWANIKVYVK